MTAPCGENTDSGLYVVSGVSPLGLSYGKFQVGDVVQAIDGGKQSSERRQKQCAGAFVCGAARPLCLPSLPITCDPVWNGIHVLHGEASTLSVHSPFARQKAGRSEGVAPRAAWYQHSFRCHVSHMRTHVRHGAPLSGSMLRLQRCGPHVFSCIMQHLPLQNRQLVVAAALAGLTSEYQKVSYEGKPSS
jgi:hypothetical protein